MAEQNQRISYNIEEAIGVTGLNRTALFKAIRNGSLKTFKTGRRRMVSRKALEEYISKMERDGTVVAA